MHESSKRYLITTLLLLLPPPAIPFFHSKIAITSYTNVNHNKRIPTNNKDPFKSLVPCNLKRYGPIDDNNILNSNLEDQETTITFEEIYEIQKSKLKTIIQEILSVKSDLEYPSILTKNLDFFLSIQNGSKLFQELLNEEKNEDEKDKIASACNLIIDFVSEFVEQTKSMDDEYKKLLGKIIRVMTRAENDNTLKEKEGKDNNGVNIDSPIPTSTERDRENALDELLQNSKEQFTPGFLRHLERECARIQSAPKLTPESAKMLQTIQVIQIRIIEELGKDLGESAIVLNQLLGYDRVEERYAVLEAGLMVRGLEFAEELLGVTDEALRGLKDIPDRGMVDGELVGIIQGIHDKVSKYIESKRS